MKKHILLATLLLSAGSVFAQGEVKVMSMQAILAGKKGKVSEAAVKKVKDKLEGELKAMVDDIQKKIKALEAKSKVADKAVIEKEAEKIEDLKKQYELKARSAQEKIQRAMSKELEALGLEVRKEAQALLDKNGWAIIISLETGEVVASAKNANVTDQIVAAVDKK